MKQTFTFLTILLIFTSQVFGQFQDLIKTTDNQLFINLSYFLTLYVRTIFLGEVQTNNKLLTLVITN